MLNHAHRFDDAIAYSTIEFIKEEFGDLVTVPNRAIAQKRRKNKAIDDFDPFGAIDVRDASLKRDERMAFAGWNAVVTGCSCPTYDSKQSGA